MHLAQENGNLRNYCSMLNIFVAVYKPKLPLQSIDELSRSADYYPIIQHGTVHQTLYQVSKLPRIYQSDLCHFTCIKLISTSRIGILENHNNF